MPAWIHPGIRAVFFDAVGTLIFPQPAAPIAYAHTASQYGLTLPEDVIRKRFLAAYRNEEQADAVTSWRTSEEREIHRWRRIVFDTLAGVSEPEACFRELFDHFALPTAWTVNPDASTVFSQLQARGLVLGLASNYDSRLWSVVKGHPILAPLRNRVVISATVGWRKPAAGFFAEVAHTAGCLPEEILYVGDDPDNDFHGATAAGLNAVLLDPRGESSIVGARSISRLAELLETG